MKTVMIHVFFLFMIAQVQAQSVGYQNEIIQQSTQSENLDHLEKVNKSEDNSLKLSIPMMGIVVVKNPTIKLQQVTLPLYAEKTIKEAEEISYAELKEK
jgi:hypothetical protein